MYQIKILKAKNRKPLSQHKKDYYPKSISTDKNFKARKAED